MRYLFAFFFVVISLQLKAQKDNVKIYKQGFISLFDDYNLPNGNWVSFENGKLRAEANFSKDSITHVLYDSLELMLIRKVLYNCNKLIKEQYFRNNIIEFERFFSLTSNDQIGPEKSYNESGELYKMRFLRNSELFSLDSLVKMFNEINYNLTPFFNENITCNYKKGINSSGQKEIGLQDFVLFEKHKNGLIKTLSNYISEDKSKSVQFQFDQNGILFSAFYFENGEPKKETIYYECGKINIITNYDDIGYVKKIEFYSEKGKLTKEEIWDNGKLIETKNYRRFF